MTNEETVAVIDSLVNAYNMGDLDQFMSHFADEAKIVHDYDMVVHDGSEGIRAFYMQPLADKHQVKVMQRISIGRHVVDLVRVTKPNAPGTMSFLTIYTLDIGKVARVDFIDHSFLRHGSSIDGRSGRSMVTPAGNDQQKIAGTRADVKAVGGGAHDRAL